MPTATSLVPRPVPGSVRRVEPQGLVTLHGISWEQYVTIADALPDWPGLRITYDGHNLEIMTTSQQHERYKKMIGRLIEMFTFEMRYRIQCGGNVTFRREDLENGLEPDECYWIRNHRQMLGVDHLDMTVHPPPDLVLEIDVTSGSIKRLPLYARLGVPEVWRFDAPEMELLLLDASGTYRPAEESLSFPGFHPESLVPFILKAGQVEENEILREFVDWLRSPEANLPRNGDGPAAGPAE
jgi:Uma2 family endonuclease